MGYIPTEKQIEARKKAFTYVAPKTGQPERYNRIREKAREFAELLQMACPESRVLSVSMTKLEESVMWANAAIARNESDT